MAPIWIQRACAAGGHDIRRLPQKRLARPHWHLQGRSRGDLILAQGAIRTLLRSVNAGDAVLITSDVSAEAAAELFPDVQRIIVTQRGIVRGLPPDLEIGGGSPELPIRPHGVSSAPPIRNPGLLLRAAEAAWGVRLR